LAKKNIMVIKDVEREDVEFISKVSPIIQYIDTPSNPCGPY